MLRHSALDSNIIEEIAGQIDVIEVFNSRSPFLQGSTKARIFAQKYGIPQSAGSDAHTLGEIGNAYVEMPEFNGKDDFLNALARGQIFGHRTNPLVHFYGIWTRFKKLF